MIYTINIKQGFPPADVAVAEALKEIDVQKLLGAKVIKIIHGHGSHGKGGLIKHELHKALGEYKHKKIIKDFVKGENFTPSSKYYNYIISACPEIIVDNDLRNPNFGITIILL